ncbi:ABC transporter ATP-binding protein [Lentibacillus sp. N15]|uniref:ABC transporter ATP-binding protein n=1 Tax=Lentibacillus songyuanensis TaxID=3136161 RepID=UPI0031BAF510
MNIVEMKGVTKKRKDFTIENMNLTIPQGYITGFIGPNGSGKTTTIQMMMDILQIDEGSIQLFGTSHHDHHVKQKIGFVYDELYMYEEFTIKKMKSIIAPLYKGWNETLFQTYIAKFALPFQKKLKHFSKGMKMKCSLLFALAHEPEFIVMDEPTAGLDPIFRRELLHLLQEIMIQEKQTILLSTHITNDLDRIADHIIFINEGKIRLQTSMEEVRENYYILKGKTSLLDDDIRNIFVGLEETTTGFQALFQGDPSIFDPFEQDIMMEQATLEDIMYYMTRKEREHGTHAEV